MTTNNTTKLLDKSETLLEWAFEEINDSNADPRGFYAEFDSFDCKPWRPEHIVDLEDAGLITLHKESDSIPSLDELFTNTHTKDELREPDEAHCGVAFVTITEKGIQYIKDNNLCD
jgi:hypothetical protein